MFFLKQITPEVLGNHSKRAMIGLPFEGTTFKVELGSSPIPERTFPENNISNFRQIFYYYFYYCFPSFRCWYLPLSV
jgi:hypothetical protein